MDYEVRDRKLCGTLSGNIHRNKWVFYARRVAPVCTGDFLYGPPFINRRQRCYFTGMRSVFSCENALYDARLIEIYGYLLSYKPNRRVIAIFHETALSRTRITAQGENYFDAQAASKTSLRKHNAQRAVFERILAFPSSNIPRAVINTDVYSRFRIRMRICASRTSHIALCLWFYAVTGAWLDAVRHLIEASTATEQFTMLRRLCRKILIRLARRSTLMRLPSLQATSHRFNMIAARLN